jgi:hypothetical protein
MDDALTLPSNDHKQGDLQFRDGLILGLLSLWLIRRRSLAALTISRHFEFDAAGLNILLYPEDTKAKRGERFRVPEQLLPYFLHYLKEIRPRLLGRSQHDGLWASYKGCPLSGGRLYDIVRARMITKFGEAILGHHEHADRNTPYSCAELNVAELVSTEIFELSLRVAPIRSRPNGARRRGHSAYRQWHAQPT